MSTPVDDAPVDGAAFIADIAARAGASNEPVKITEGAFAFYADPDGSVMAVMSVPDGDFAGTHRFKIRPGMIKAITALAGGGGKLAALTGRLGKRKP